MRVVVLDHMPVSGFADLNGRFYDLWARQGPGPLPTTPDGTYDAVAREVASTENVILTVDGRELYLVPAFCD